MDTLKTKSGKTFSISSFSEISDPDQVHIRICGSTIAEISSVFSDLEETEAFWVNGMYYSGYTKFVALVPETRCVRIVLGRE